MVLCECASTYVGGSVALLRLRHGTERNLLLLNTDIIRKTLRDCAAAAAAAHFKNVGNSENQMNFNFAFA